MPDPSHSRRTITGGEEPQVLQSLAPLFKKDRAEPYCSIDAHAVMLVLAKNLGNKTAILQQSLRQFINKAFRIEADAVRARDESVGDMLPWRNMVEQEFHTTRATLERIKSGVLGQVPGTDPEKLAGIWFENLLVEKYRFVLPAWRDRSCHGND